MISLTNPDKPEGCFFENLTRKRNITTIVDDSYKHGGVLLHMHLSQSKPTIDHEYEGLLFHVIVHGLVLASILSNQTVLHMSQ